MRVVIAGSRSFTNMDIFRIGISLCPFAHKIESIIHGGAVGADGLAELWAEENGIPSKVVPVTREEWKKLGKKAGPLRNIRMIDEADAYIGFWDGKSPGTKQGIAYATQLHKPVYVYRIDQEPNILELLSRIEGIRYTQVEVKK